MMRDEIRRRALRAAAAVSMIAGVMGCGVTVVVDDEEPIDEEPVEEGPSAEGPAAEEPEGPLADAGAEEDAEVPGDGSVADAETTCGDLMEDWESYSACCEKVEWKWEAGCQAWGPPVPPQMPEMPVMGVA